MVKLTESTKSISAKTFVRNWRLFDADQKVLGRLASEIAASLIGKNRVDYVDYLDMGDEVVVVNAPKVVVTGSKAANKTYDSFSGFPGGLRKISYEKMNEKRPGEVLRHAVSGMLPKNKLRDKRLARLHIYSGETHEFANKFT